MAAAVTPARPELLALKSRLDNADLRHNGGKTAYALLPEDRRSLALLVEAALAADEGVREALIPAGIYFDIDGSNFYSVERGCGCGQIFYSEWRSRAREFPQSKEAALALMPPWLDMKSAPRNATEIVLRIPSAGYPDHYAQIGHWAEMDGSEQPSAKGWFRNTGSGFVELSEPTGWRWQLMIAPSSSTTGEPKR